MREPVLQFALVFR